MEVLHRQMIGLSKGRLQEERQIGVGYFHMMDNLTTNTNLIYSLLHRYKILIVLDLEEEADRHLHLRPLSLHARQC